MDGRLLERKLAAILSADVEGYSRLMGDNEAATVRTISEYREAIASAVARHAGRVVDAPVVGHASDMRQRGDRRARR